MRNPDLAVDVYTSPVRQGKLTERLWERYLAGERSDTAVRKVVAESWSRCEQSGVHPLRNEVPVLLSEKEVLSRVRTDRLMQLARPWLVEMEAMSADSAHLAVVADASGLLLAVEGDRAIRRRAERMRFLPGARWAEASAGTNAIGTALATGGPVQIFAAEHWCQRVHPWTCSAAPVRDPVTGAVLGVIDLTGPFRAVHPHSLSTVLSAARAIEVQLRREAECERAAVLEAYHAARRYDQTVLGALDRGGHVIAGSPALEEEGLLGPDGRPAGLPDTAAPGPPGAHVWEAEGRRGRYECELRAVADGGRILGFLLRASLRGGRRPSVSVTTRCRFEDLIGESEGLRRVMAAARQAAGHLLPVLILGESGTGKELLAQAIHAAGPRSGGPFVAVNCGAIPRELAASEFFGYEPGSFTGASRLGKPGKFEQAQGGTLFLDEVGEMPEEVQVHLLRVLEEREVTRIGGSRPVRLDVRVIAATGADLESAVREGRFRRDLYYRLSVVTLVLPPLRDRREDIPLLLAHFLRCACRELGRPSLQVGPEALEVLRAYSWPGNVRELRNVAYRLALEAPGAVVELGHLPPEIVGVVRPGSRRAGPRAPATRTPGRRLAAGPAALPPVKAGRTLEEYERELIRAALRESGGNVAAAARRLGIHRSTIYRKLAGRPSVR